MRMGIGEGTATALSTSYTAIEVSPIPRRIQLGLLTGQITSISSATQLTVYIAADSAGDHALTAAETVTIVPGATTATDGGFGLAIDVPYDRPSWGSGESLWVVAKTDAGTCTLKPGVTWRGL